MIEIDGKKGGGQMLRTALTLSTVTGDNFEMENIRGSRKNPGLKRQHMEAVNAAGKLCNAKIEGDEIGSEELVFKPGNLVNRSFTSNIGTAGSITLLMDTVLPVTSQFSDDFRFTAKGGTDVKWSPTFDYFSQIKLPLLHRFGLEAATEADRRGYYPKGGGEAVLRTSGSSMKPVELVERGELEKLEIYSKAAKELEEQAVADRQADEAARILKNSHVSTPLEKKVEYVETDSPGSSLLVKAVYENSIAGFDSLGEKGKRSEEVAKEAVEDFKKFHSSGAAVDSYMADQLVVFLSLVGGEVVVPELTDHIQTSLEVVKKFGKEVEYIEKGGEGVLSR